jgi:beta-lactamase class A
MSGLQSPFHHVRRAHVQSRPFLLLSLLVAGIALGGCGAGVARTSNESPSDAPSASASESVAPTPFAIHDPAATPAPTATVTATSIAPPAASVSDSPMVSTLDTLLASEPGVYGVVVLDEQGNYLYARNENVPFVAASLYKLVLLADIYARIEAGEVGLQDPLVLDDAYFDDIFVDEDGFFTSDDIGGTTTIEQALYGAGAYSSNIAAKALMTLTSPDALRQRAESFGMMDSFFTVQIDEVPHWPERYRTIETEDAAMAIAFVEAQAEFNPLNITTPNDIARFWHTLLQGRIVSPDVSNAILYILREQVVTDRLPALLPQGIWSANKTGNLYHVVHDSGILFAPDETVVVTALSEGEPDDQHGALVIQRIGLAAIGETVLPPIGPLSSPEPPADDQSGIDEEAS